MANPAHIPDHDPMSESDDITEVTSVIAAIPNRELVAAAGCLARAEQTRLEKELGLQNGRTPRPGRNGDPPGVFRSDEGPAALT